jgi:hypothetical protein
MDAPRENHTGKTSTQLIVFVIAGANPVSQAPETNAGSG